MRVLVAPQEFKGTLTARAAAATIGAALRRALPGAGVEELPLADGGPGTVDALVAATGGRLIESPAHDPLGRPLRARWGALGERPEAPAAAAIEMAAASGLVLLAPEERDPLVASTSGTGELIAAALDAGFRRIIVGVGGSATNDGGAGAAQALGARLLDAQGADLPPGGGALEWLARVDASGVDPRLRDCDIVVATDVSNPLCGPDGASIVYAPQKGATPEVAQRLEAALAHYATVLRRDLGVEVDVPGGGAAGGLAAALVAFCGATLRPGFDVVAEAVGLRERIAAADAAVTGEGRLDRQSAFGKTPAGVARLARELSKPVVAVVGSAEADAGAALGLDAVFALTDAAPLEVAMRDAARCLTEASMRAGAWLAERA